MAFQVITDEFAQQYGYESREKLARDLRAKKMPGYKHGKYWKVDPVEFDQAFRKTSNTGADSEPSQGQH